MVFIILIKIKHGLADFEGNTSNIPGEIESINVFKTFVFLFKITDH